MNKRAECVRTVANWSITDKAYTYDHRTFDKDKMLEAMPVASPKMEALFKKIDELDEADMKKHGKKFKHMVFTDIKSSAYGAKLLAAGFAAKGYHAAYDRGLEIDTTELKKTEGQNFAVLCSTVIYGKPLGVKFRKKILDVFNRRPDNVYGELVRFIILDQGFKEGIDLYDIKYIHLFEPLVSAADEKQAVGRGTRLCGQKGLEFDPKRGWPLYVIRYEVSIPGELHRKFDGSTRMFELFMRESRIDLRKLVFANTLEEMCIYGAVDKDLTKNVHNFNIRSHDEDEEMSVKKVRSLLGLDRRFSATGGVRKKKHNYKRVNAPRNKKGFAAMQEFIRERFAKYTWPPATLENQCVAHGGADIVEFNPTQDFVRLFFQPHSSYKGMMLWHSTGTGKCHARDTPIVMYDGRVKMVQDVVVGDLLMGDDSTPRRVLSLASGEDMMFDVVPCRGGDTYTVNSEHILCLKDMRDGTVVEMTVTDYLALPAGTARLFKGYRAAAVTFAGEKFIGDAYDVAVQVARSYGRLSYDLKTSTVASRLDALAGIVDAFGGYLLDVGYDTSTGRDIAFLARSLGICVDRASDDRCIALSGSMLSKVPTRFYKHVSTEADGDASTCYIDVRPIGKGTYYGFTLDGNNRYLLGDFTVTHNTCTAVATATTSWERQGYSILWVTRHTLKPDIWKNMYKQVCSLVVRDRIKRGEIPDDAIKKPLKYTSKMWLPPVSYKQFSNALLGRNELYHELVRRNGKDDMLKKTFIIIDEAHKFFAKDVPAAERPDVATIYAKILDSYDASGADSARVLLMTATPYTTDPMDMLKLLNLMRPRTDAITEDFDEFARTYLASDGSFSDDGGKKFLDKIAGYISYLNREKDARQFSYPVYENVIVPMSRSNRLMRKEELDAVVAETAMIEENVARGTEAVKRAKKQARDDKTNMNKECMDRFRTAAERKACKDEVAARMTQFERELLTDLETRLRTDKDRLGDLKKRAKDLKKQVRDKKADMSQEAALDGRCGI